MLLGAVVTKNVEPYAIVGGVPTRMIRYRFNKQDREYLLNLKWWTKDLQWIKRNAQYFDDIEKIRLLEEDET